MKFIGKIFIFMTLLTGIAVHGAELKEQAAQKELDEQLIHAVAARSTDQVRTLLLQKANPDCRDAIHTKAISYAIENCDPNIVELLLCQRADADRVCQFARTPLTLTMEKIEEYIEAGVVDKADLYVSIADLLLYHGADPNKCYVSERPLKRCLMFINWATRPPDLIPAYNLAGLLLEYRADDIRDFAGATIHDYAKTNPGLQNSIDLHFKKHRETIKQAAADGLPRFSMDVVGVVAGYVI